MVQVTGTIISCLQNILYEGEDFMKLMVYKGFEYETLKQMPGHPLVNGDISEKKNVVSCKMKLNS